MKITLIFLSLSTLLCSCFGIKYHCHKKCHQDAIRYHSTGNESWIYGRVITPGRPPNQ